MEMIKRYLYAVGKRLPKKQRADIEKEIESAILDSLEDLYGKSEQYNDEQISTVLSQYGSPAKVAAGYQKHSGYLIGPELINTYFMVIKIVAGAVTLGMVIAYIVGLFETELSLLSVSLGFLEMLSSLLSGIITAIGFVTVVFYLVQRFVPEYKLADLQMDNDWTPKDLPEIPAAQDKISIGESVAGIVFTVILIVLFNFYASSLGIYYTPTWGEEWQFLQVFSMDALSFYLPFWNVVWIAGLVFHIYCLMLRKWNIKTRIFEMGLSIMSIIVLAIMIQGPELVMVQSLLANASPDIAASLTPIAEWFNYSIDKLLILILVLTAVGLLVKMVKFILAIIRK